MFQISSRREIMGRTDFSCCHGMFKIKPFISCLHFLVERAEIFLLFLIIRISYNCYSCTLCTTVIWLYSQTSLEWMDVPSFSKLPYVCVFLFLRHALVLMTGMWSLPVPCPYSRVVQPCWWRLEHCFEGEDAYILTCMTMSYFNYYSLSSHV